MSFLTIENYTVQELAKTTIGTIIGVLLAVTIISICIYYISRYLETIYFKIYRKPYFIHFYTRLQTLPNNLSSYLHQNSLYNTLNPKRKRFFEHRVVQFLKKTEFVGREQLQITDEIKMKISMLFIQLTFGMRAYLLEYLQTIIVYPSTYFSVLNQTENKGEFNPLSKALALSWKDFQKGNRKKDGVNLGIHEGTHAIHYNAIKNTDISSEIFYDTFLELEKYLGSEKVRNEIIGTNLLRDYAYTDKFEFIAVLVEVFMESPYKLKKKLPEVYEYVVRMLNFRYFDKK